jgi:hypothetical protein
VGQTAREDHDRKNDRASHFTSASAPSAV